MTSNSTIPCRLCQAPAERVFSLKVLHKHDAGYYRCSGCGSLQTEQPHWLDEAYKDPRPVRDIWMVRRNQCLQAMIYFVTKLFSWKPENKLADWGGGNGLLVRMLRDAGIQAFVSDKYVQNHYAIGFEDNPEVHARMITAFEVWEHLSDPLGEIEAMFARQPEIHMLSTTLYREQGPDWSYLAPNSGRHVFLYSEKAMAFIARKYGYHHVATDKYTVFHKNPLTPWRRLALRWLLTTWKHGWLLAAFALAHKKELNMSDSNALLDRGLI